MIDDVFPIAYDQDVWIRVPLDFRREQWDGPEEWAEWVRDSASRDRPDDRITREAIRRSALDIATFDTAHASARFWHFPVDRSPTGFVDVFAQVNRGEVVDPESLLPALPYTLADPAVLVLDGTPFDKAIRRLYLVPLSAEQLGAVDGPTGLLARGEWLAVTRGWVVLIASFDFDPGVMTSRLGDTDALLGGIRPEDLHVLDVAD